MSVRPNIHVILGTHRRYRNCSVGVARRLGLSRPLSRRQPCMSQLAYVAKMTGGKHNFIEMARLSNDERVRGLVRRWNSTSPSDQKYISLDSLCEACGIEPAELFGAVVAGCYESGLDTSPLVLASFNYLRVVEAIIRCGLRAEGDDKRERLLRRVGLLD
jgi:hypothetical protein